MNTDINTNNATPDPSVIQDFSKWKEFLGDRVDQAQSVGMSDQQIADVAFRMGNFLSDKIDPKNVQNRLLKQMWEVSSKEDQKALARIVVSLVQQPTTH